MGRVVTLKRRVKYIDPSLPTFVKLPANPMPRTWAMVVRPYVPFPSHAHPKCVFKVVETDLVQQVNRMIDPNPKEEGQQQKTTTTNESTESSTTSSCPLGEFEGIYMDPPWELPGRPNQHRAAITPSMLRALDLPRLMPYGLLFIWVEKEVIRELLDVTRAWGMEYVEHFAAVNVDVNNTFAAGFPHHGAVFQRTKSTLLIFRRKKDQDDNLELRHQRSADTTFEMVRRYARGIVHERCDFAYNVIETLLPNAAYKDDTGRGKLLHLWSSGYANTRPGWTSICDKRTISD